MNDDIFDVAIIGCGPTGAVLAHLLALQGLTVLILEREAGPCQLPRAVHFDGEVMRVLQWIGAADRMLPLTTPHPGMRFVDAAGQTLLDWPRPQETGPQGWRANYRFHQPELEAVLREGLAERATVTLKSRCEAFMLEEHADHVALSYEDMAVGRVRRARARYVVGADGARSTVRRFIDTPMEDLGFHERWLVVDVELRRDLPDLGQHTVQFCTPERPATYSPGPGLRRRWEITVLPGEDSNAIVVPDQVWSLLAPWLKRDEARLERTAVYTFHSLVAQDWRRGRLLLAGDACHQTPPFMGQGLCAGVRDAANLFWKLALACRNHPQTEALLASYTSERRPNARAYVATAVQLGGLINTVGTAAALRAALPGANGTAQMKSIAPPLGAGLGQGPHAGVLAAQPLMADGARMDDALPFGFVLLTYADALNGMTPGTGITALTPEDAPGVARLLQTYGARAVLLRPDRHVMATGNDAAAMIAAASPFLEQKSA